MSIGFSFHILNFKSEIDGKEHRFQSHGGFIMLLLCIAAFVPAIPVPSWVGFAAIGAWVLFNGIGTAIFFAGQHTQVKKMDEGLIKLHQQEQEQEQEQDKFQDKVDAALERIYEAKEVYLGLVDNNPLHFKYDRDGQHLSLLVITTSPETFDELSEQCLNNVSVDIVADRFTALIRKFTEHMLMGILFVSDDLDIIAIPPDQIVTYGQKFMQEIKQK